MTAFKPVRKSLTHTGVHQAKDESQYGASFKPPGKSQGIPCPECGCRHYSTVEDTRPRGNKIKRERTCINCKKVFITLESFEAAK